MIPAPTIADAAPLISAAAGVAGVVVTLSGELLRRRWQRPKLRLLPFRAENGDGVFMDILSDGTQSAWIRLGIRNEGREAARDVEVHIENIVLIGSQPDARRLEAFQKQPLSLLIGRRLGWPDRDDKMIDIPRGMVRRIDIAHLCTGEPCYLMGDVLAVPIRLTLDRASPINRRDVVPGLNYYMQVSLSGSNFQSALFDVRLDFGGSWLGSDSVNPLVDGSLRVVQVAPAPRSRSGSM